MTDVSLGFCGLEGWLHSCQLSCDYHASMTWCFSCFSLCMLGKEEFGCWSARSQHMEAYTVVPAKPLVSWNHAAAVKSVSQRCICCTDVMHRLSECWTTDLTILTLHIVCALVFLWGRWDACRKLSSLLLKGCEWKIMLLHKARWNP